MREADGRRQSRGRSDTSRLISLAILVRLVVDTAQQLFNPFLPMFATGLGVDIITLGRLVSLRTGVGIVAPAVGTFADRWGYRRVLRLELALGIAGTLLFGASRNLWAAAAGMVLMGIGLSSFAPTLQAYVSNRLPWERRGRGLAMVEYAWALAGIVGLFLMGFVIALAGWRAPFFLLAGGLGLAWLAFGGIQSSRVQGDGPRAPAGDWQRRVGNFFRLGANGRSARSTMLVAGLIGLAGTTVVIVHGAWLNRSYGLGTTQLGTVALLLGLADLAGSGLASLIVDRLGKRRSVLFGSGAAALAYFALPWFDVGPVPAVAGLALGRFFFEFSLVSNLALQSEQSPAERAKVMSQGAMVTLLGFSLAGIAGPWLFEWSGVAAFSWFGAGALALAVLVLLVGVKEPQAAVQAVPKVTPS